MGIRVIRPTMLAALAAIGTSSYAAEADSYRPADGFVPDSQTAVAIAYAVATPIYGKAVLNKELPLVAKLDGAIWTVEGTHRGIGVGGVVTIRIDRASGAILYVMHGK